VGLQVHVLDPLHLEHLLVHHVRRGEARGHVPGAAVRLRRHVAGRIEQAGHRPQARVQHGRARRHGLIWIRDRRPHVVPDFQQRDGAGGDPGTLRHHGGDPLPGEPHGAVE
jgi:hypothetical protein